MCNKCEKKKYHCKKTEGYVTVPSYTLTNPDQVIPEGQIFYRMMGKNDPDRPTLFFISGFGNNLDTWLCQQTGLCKKFNTVAVDWRGVGKSSKTTGIIYTFDVFAHDFHTVVQTLGLQHVTLVGQSIGTAMAIKYILNYPNEIEKLVTVGGFPTVFADLECYPGCPRFPTPPFPSFLYDFIVDFITNDYEGFKMVFAANSFNEECQDELANVKAQSLESGWAPHDIAVNGFIPGWVSEDITHLISQVNVPTFITYGGIDLVVPVQNSFFLRSVIPNSTLQEFPQHGHFPNVTDYKRFNCLIKKFVLDELPTGCEVCPLIKPSGTQNRNIHVLSKDVLAKSEQLKQMIQNKK